MKDLLLRIAFRWTVNTLGLATAGRLVPDITYERNYIIIIVAGLALSLLNLLVKPLVVILSLPAIVFSLGLFMVIVNGLMVYLVSLLVPAFVIRSFGAAVLAGLIVGLLNYAVTIVLEERLFNKS